MKNLFLFAFFTVLSTKCTTAQVSKVMPEDADHFYNTSMPLLRPVIKTVVTQSAKAIENRKINTDSLSVALRRNYSLKGMGNNEIEGIIILIMVQVSRDADADLKRMVLEISRNNNQKNAATALARSSAQKDSLAETSCIQHLKLKMIIERKSDIAEEIGDAMKKIAAPHQDIINNLR
jgi:hypothetical protein